MVLKLNRNAVAKAYWYLFFLSRSIIQQLLEYVHIEADLPNDRNVSSHLCQQDHYKGVEVDVAAGLISSSLYIPLSRNPCVVEPAKLVSCGRSEEKMCHFSTKCFIPLNAIFFFHGRAIEKVRHFSTKYFTLRDAVFFLVGQK